MASYHIKVLKEDGTDYRANVATERIARQRALSIYTLAAERGERCTVRIYADNKLIGVVNAATANRRR